MRAKAAVPAGAPDHARAGERSEPSHPNLTGMAPPSAKLGLVRTKPAIAVSFDVVGVGDAEPLPPAQAARSRGAASRVARIRFGKRTRLTGKASADEARAKAYRLLGRLVSEQPVCLGPGLVE